MCNVGAGMNIHFDMETGDPDDIFALALLATHPRSNLCSVTVHPGGTDQIGLVKHILKLLGKDVPVGGGTPKNDKPRVSEFYYNWLGSFDHCNADASAKEVIQDTLSRYQDVSLVTGAALTNVAAALRESDKTFADWTCQGGFAGSNVMGTSLPKFEGLKFCPTYNLGGDPGAAEMLLMHPPLPIPRVKMVSKSVCHGVFYTPEVDSRIPSGKHAGLDLLKRGMKFYFKKHPDGKALHDVVAAVAALSPEIGSWARVRVLRDRGQWGTELAPESPISIMTGFDSALFESALFTFSL